MTKTHRIEAGSRTAHWDFRKLAPKHLRCSGLFWADVLRFSGISAEQEEFAWALLGNYGPRQIARFFKETRSRVLNDLREVFREIKTLIERNQLWLETYKPDQSKGNDASHRPQLVFVRIGRRGNQEFCTPRSRIAIEWMRK